MPLKFKFKSREEIPAEHQALYVERDGAFVLDAEGAVEKSKVDEFRSNNLTLKKQLDEVLKKFEGIDPDEARKLFEQKQKLEEGQLLKEGDVEKIVLARVKAAIEPIEKRAQTAEQSAGKLSERLADIEINRAVIVAATKLGLRASAIPDLTLRARTVFRMVDGKAAAFDADGKTPLYGADGLTPLTLDEWAAKLVVEAPHLFEPNDGGGATGSVPGSGATHATHATHATTHLTQSMFRPESLFPLRLWVLAPLRSTRCGMHDPCSPKPSTPLREPSTPPSTPPPSFRPIKSGHLAT